MHMAMLMKPILAVTDEEIITQGDEADYFYVLLNGAVTIYLN